MDEQHLNSELSMICMSVLLLVLTSSERIFTIKSAHTAVALSAVLFSFTGAAYAVCGLSAQQMLSQLTLSQR